MSRGRQISTGLVVYDGECGFCSWSVRFWGRVTEKCDFVPYQSLSEMDFDNFGLERDEVAAAVHYLRLADNKDVYVTYAGAEAVGKILSKQGLNKSIRGAGGLILLPGVRFIAKHIYALTARYRGFLRLPGSAGSCAME